MEREALQAALRRKANRPFEAFDGPVVYCRVKGAAVSIYSQPSHSSRILERKQKGAIIVIQNDGNAEDRRPGWFFVLDTKGDKSYDESLKWICPGDHIEPLPYCALEVVFFLRACMAIEISAAEKLLLDRIERISNNMMCQSQLLEFGQLPDNFAYGFCPRTIAYNSPSDLIIARDPGPGNSFHVRTARLIRSGELIETCRILELKDAPGPVLEPHSFELGPLDAVGSPLLGMPLGYAAICHRDTGVTGLSCNVQLSIVSWSGGGYAMLVHATCDIHPAQEIVFPSKKACECQPPPGKDRCTLDLGEADQLRRVSSGHVCWKKSHLHGAGVFALKCLEKNSVVEVCPVLKLDPQSRKAAADYSMKIEPHGSLAPAEDILALGCGALYNHQSKTDPRTSKTPADWWYDRSLEAIVIIAQDQIHQGMEVCIDYGEQYWRSRDMREDILSTCQVEKVRVGVLSSRKDT